MTDARDAQPGKGAQAGQSRDWAGSYGPKGPQGLFILTAFAETACDLHCPSLLGWQ